MRQIGKSEWKKCEGKGCNVKFHVLKCRHQRFCSQECAFKNKSNKVTGWHWEKNIKEGKMNAEELAAPRATIFTGGYDKENDSSPQLWGYSEGEVL